MPWVEDFDRDAPGTRRFSFAFAGEHPPDLQAHLDRLAARDAEQIARANARVDVPAFRKPPLGTGPLRILTSRTFPVEPTCGHSFALEDISVHETGLQFDLVARPTVSPTADKDVRLAVETGAVGSTTAATRSTYLGLVLPDGAVVTNKKSFPRFAPDDGDRTTSWMHAGKTRKTGGEVRTTYFVSPLPDLEATIAVT